MQSIPYRYSIFLCGRLMTVEHNNGMGEFSINVASATHSSYSQWATRTATITATTGTATATATYSTSPIPTSTSYDYIVVGGGVRQILSSASFLACRGAHGLLCLTYFSIQNTNLGVKVNIGFSRLEVFQWQINSRKVASLFS